jgi:CMP-N,N'-diacetyllegionaminic acid synthase
MTQVIVVIPARSGSKGVVDKNIREVQGHPLIGYSIAVAKKIRSQERVILSTDSQKYADIGGQFGAEVPFLRPKAISGDNSSDLECFLHLLDFLSNSAMEIPELIVHLRPTTPIRSIGVVEKAIKALQEDPSATALRSVQEMSQSAYKFFEYESPYLLTIFTRDAEVDAANAPRHQFPKTYAPNGYVDVLKTSTIRSGKLHGDRVIGYLTPPSIEIDTIDDLNTLEEWAEKNPDYVAQLFQEAM